MIGHIVEFDRENGRGIIDAINGKKYSFYVQDIVAGSDFIDLEKKVNFETDGDKAKSLVVLIKYKYMFAFLSIFFGAFGLQKFYIHKTQLGSVLLVSGLSSLMVIAYYVGCFKLFDAAACPGNSGVYLFAVIACSVILGITVLTSFLRGLRALGMDDKEFYKEFVLS